MVQHADVDATLEVIPVSTKQMESIHLTCAPECSVDEEHSPPLAREAWEQTVRTTFAGVTPLVRSEQPFEGRLAAFGFGAGRLISAGSRPVDIYRKVECRDATSDTVNLFVLLNGSATVKHCSHSVALKAGDVLVLDGVRGFAAEMITDYRQLTLQFPRDLIGRRHRGLLHQAGVRLEGEDPATCLVRQTAAMLAETGGLLSHEQRAYAFDAFVGLLGTLPGTDLDSGSTGARRFSRALADIEVRLADPDLCAAQIAALQGISPRRLVTLFAERGQSVERFIWERRLERAALDIATTTKASRPLFSIAMAWGFSSAAHFSRRFCAKFGMSPSQYRQVARPSGE